MSTIHFYPALSTLLPKEKIPFSDWLDGFDDLFYRNFNIRQSDDGSYTAINIEIVIYKTVTLADFLDVRLTLNNPNATAEIAIPLQLEIGVEILSHIPGLSLSEFGGSAEEYLQIVAKIAGTDAYGILDAAVETFTSQNAVSEFIADYNQTFSGNGISTQSGLTREEYLNYVLSELSQRDQHVLDAILLMYIDTGNIEDSFSNISALFQGVIGAITIERIASMFLPDISAVIDGVNLYAEFPRTILIPVDGNDDPIPDQKSFLTISGGSLKYSTRKGFEFSDQGTISFSRSLIGGTGFIASFSGLKIDLSTESSIPEAMADGRGPAFVGVFIEQADITLPKTWNTSTTLIGRNLIVGTEGGISGTIGLESNDLSVDFFGLDFTLNQFTVSLHQNEVYASSLAGTLTIAGVKDTNNQDAVFTVLGEYQTNGFYLDASIAAGIALNIGNQLDIILTSLKFTRNNEDDSYGIGLSGSLQFAGSDVPLVSKLLPETILVNELVITNIGGLETFDVDIRWKNDPDSIQVNTVSGGVELVVPVNKSIGGTFLVDVLKASIINRAPQPGAAVRFLIDGSLTIGPVNATATDFGFGTDILFDENSGDVGPLKFANPGVVLPSGVGIAINSEGISGGGFLSFDHDRHQYSGVLDLNVKNKFSVTAIGILVTELPGGEPGFSLLAMINVTFSPAVQLGFGFTLSGLGGLLGIQRTTDAQAFRNGVRNGGIDRIMFPDDPIRNAPLIISDLNAFFPIAANRYVFGFMGQINYGTPAVITGNIGLIIEVPDPIRLILAGVIKSILPNKDKTLLQLQVAFVGIIDFGRQFISFDASLFDSRVASYSISGDMALRMVGGDKPNFLITAGGFHPQYTPPPLDLPTIRRLAIDISAGSNLTVRAEAYFAVSSNSFQFGAGIYIKATAGKASADAHFSFDVLFQFDPFRFYINISASFNIRYRGKSLLGASAAVNLCGPNQWHADGYLKVKIFIWQVKVRFDKTWGRKEIEPSVPNVYIFPKLIEALQDPVNWSSQLGNRNTEQVTLREIQPSTDIIADPTTTLEVNQRVVPLNYTINQYGKAKPADFNRFFISRATIGTKVLGNADFQYQKDFFPPSLFRDLDDNSKLKGPSFTKFDSGVKFTRRFDETEGGSCIHRSLDYERIVMDTSGRKKLVALAELSPMLAGFAAGNAAARHANAQQFNPSASQPKVALTEEEFVLMDTDNLNQVGTQAFSNALQAEEALEEMFLQDPSLEDRVQVAPKYELDNC